MTPPNKCEAVRRASIRCADLKECDELSSEAKILYTRFDEAHWQWVVIVEHDILPLLSPGQEAVAYHSVKVFNRMIEQSIAKAIAGVSAEEGDPQASALRVLASQLGQLGGQYYSSTGSSLPGGYATSSGGIGSTNLGQATTTWNVTP